MATKEAKAQELNIYQKLAKIRKNLEVLQKDKSGYGYKYVSEAEIMSKLSVWLDKMGLLLYPRIVPETVTAYTEELESIKLDKKTGEMVTEKKNETIAKGEMVFTWVNIDNPEEKLEVPWFFAGQQADTSQAFGSGLTYCNRYFLLKFFNIATTEDDPDNWRSKQQAEEKKEEVALAQEILQLVDKAAKSYVESSEDRDKAKAELVKLTKKYVKSGNYLKIEEPALAKKLLEDMKALAGDTKEEK